MTRHEVLEFLRRQRFGVQASVSASGAPQAAVVGFTLSDAFELFFDTLDDSRKNQNLMQNPKCAFVVWEGERTVQLEGLADHPEGAELERLKQLYFATFPDGPSRRAWPHICYVRVRPSWVRYSDFGGASPEISVFEDFSW